MRAPCPARKQVAGLTCHLGNHPGVLHYDEDARIWWVGDEELVMAAETRRIWDDSWFTPGPGE